MKGKEKEKERGREKETEKERERERDLNDYQNMYPPPPRLCLILLPRSCAISVKIFHYSLESLDECVSPAHPCVHPLLERSTSGQSPEKYQGPGGPRRWGGAL